MAKKTSSPPEQNKSEPNKKADTPVEGSQTISSGLVARFRRYFLTGVLVTAPISITVYLTYLFLTFVDSKVVHLLPAEWYEAIYAKTTIPGLGLVIVIAGFIVIGWFATNFLGRLFIRLSEYIVEQMPVIRTLYGAIKQIFETIMASQSSAFREVVMLEYPRKGVWSIGFVTGMSQGEVQSCTEQETVNVFVPTTPNPTSGYLLFVPKKELTYLQMSVEEGVKLVVSAGIISPPEHKEEENPEKPHKKTGFFNLHKSHE